VVAGGRRKYEEWSAEDNETVKLLDSEESAKLAKDPFYKLEYQNADKQKAIETAPQLEKLQDLQQTKQDDFLLNQLLRKSFRVCCCDDYCYAYEDLIATHS
jgi:hypothetical protein